VIEVQGLTKDYGTVIAVRDVSFSVGRGEVVGFLGPNGAGKSTTLRILAGFLGATSGKVTIGGFDIAEQSLEARAQLGYMPEAAPLYPELRVREYLEFRARLKRVPRARRRQNVERALERAHVADVSETTIGHLSKGYRQRVGLADALVADPPLLILDEPTAGLDPNQVREVRALIQELSAEHTVLLSTHILSEVEATCQRALVIDRGRLVAQGTLAELARGRRSSTLVVVLRDPDARASGILGGQTYVSAVMPDASVALADGYSRLRITLAENEPALSSGERLLQALHGAGIAVASLAPEVATLEQTFADLTRDEPEAETP
jgi:ABC-2 type transport system ATP-binding protein